MPRMPKDPSTRARRNKSSTKATLVEPVGDVDIPELPRRYSESISESGRRSKSLIPWHAMTVAWWNDIWPSPMADEWHPTDIHGLYRLANLVDAYWKSTDLSEQLRVMVEIRLSSQPYGLTPLDRRRLEWQIETSEDAKAKGRRRTNFDAEPLAVAPTTTRHDPRLSLVK